MTTTTPETFTSPATDADTGLRDGYAEIGDVKLHYVEAGDGPLVVLLHGFPEFWYGWRQQIAPLAKAGFRVVAPDLRGYNLSSRPDGYAAYTADKLAGDIRGLIRGQRERERPSGNRVAARRGDAVQQHGPEERGPPPAKPVAAHDAARKRGPGAAGLRGSRPARFPTRRLSAAANAPAMTLALPAIHSDAHGP
jgi:alpha/beta hydrolase fold